MIRIGNPPGYFRGNVPRTWQKAFANSSGTFTTKFVVHACAFYD